MPKQSAKYEIRADTSGFRKLMADVKEFDPMLARSLRRNLRRIGDTMAGAVRSEAQGAGANIGPAIAAGVRVQVSTGTRRQGVSIVASSSGLPAAQASLNRAFNKVTFRHPVFGRTVYVDQAGHPYFAEPLAVRYPDAQRAVEAALDEAISVIHNH